MSTSSLDNLVKQLVTNGALRDRLVSDPKAVFAEFGCESEATNEMVAALSKVNPGDLANLARGFEAGRSSDRVAA